MVLYTYLDAHNDDDDDDEDNGNEQADPLLFSGTAGIDNGHVNLLVSCLQVNFSLLNIGLDCVEHLSLFCNQGLHVDEELVQFL